MTTTAAATTMAPRVLVAHERPVLARAIQRVLAAQGLRAEAITSGDAVARALQLQTWDALVLDVGLPGPPVHQLVALARTGGATAVRAVVLITSVFRRGSYKRAPQQLYGADDYVEVHQLGAQLASKLWRLLAAEPAGLDGMLEAEALLVHLAAPASSMGETDEPPHADSPYTLARLLVADLVMHSGDRLADADTPEQARAALADDLAAARARHAELVGPPASEDDPIDVAFDELVRPAGEDPGAAWK